MAGSLSNDDILQQLRLGIIDFEISSSPVPLVSTHFPRSSRPFWPITDAKPWFFARIGNLAGSGSPALKKVERYSVRRVAGMDAACFVPWQKEWLSTKVRHLSRKRRGKMQMIYGWLSERSSVTMAMNGINKKRR